jgi:hypothetical protein
MRVVPCSCQVAHRTAAELAVCNLAADAESGETAPPAIREWRVGGGLLLQWAAGSALGVVASTPFWYLNTKCASTPC